MQNQSSSQVIALKQAFEENSLSSLLTDEKAVKLVSFANLLTETNKTTNLTAITDYNEIILKHFIDCASVAHYIPNSAKIIDVGCGAGFPTIPLAILREDIEITPLDSTGKKIDFVKHAANEFELANVFPICARAEEMPQKREQFDVCVSRAVARLNILSELCIPFVKLGGIFIAMKSSKGNEEHDEAQSGINKLGCTLLSSHKDKFNYLESEIERELYIYKKIQSTPAQYPRKYAQILKKPL